MIQKQAEFLFNSLFSPFSAEESLLSLLNKKRIYHSLNFQKNIIVFWGCIRCYQLKIY